MGKSAWLWIGAVCGVVVVALSYVMSAPLRLAADREPAPLQLVADKENAPPAITDVMPPPQDLAEAPKSLPIAGEKSLPIADEQTCKRDEERLVRLRATQTRDELIRFERELGCERLRPQLLRLGESILADGERGEPDAAQQPSAEQPNRKNDTERPAPLAAPAAGSAPAATRPPPTPVVFEKALLQAANDLFAKANLQDAPQKVVLVIDPLIDGATGAESNATQLMERRIVDLVRNSYPRFEVARFSSASLAKAPVVLIGTFTAINNAGLAGGPRDAYRICLALADLHARKIISKGVARALPEGIDATPTSFFAESPVFAKDASTEAYIKSCQGTQPGDPIEQVYADRILVASLINDGVQAYNAKRYKDALNLYQSALLTPGGEQLRVLNGIYLANYELRRRSDATEAFGKVVDYGLKGDRLAVKFLFRPGSTEFAREHISAPYETWIEKIAERTAAKKACLEIVGHTSATGLAAVNDRLSALRAGYIKDRLEAGAGELRGHLIATGRGSRELIVGTGRDDTSDAVDRRVEFKVIQC
jgi:outer membrane protein OmpA-like peptidoglycan-associated protein